MPVWGSDTLLSRKEYSRGFHEKVKMPLPFVASDSCESETAISRHSRSTLFVLFSPLSLASPSLSFVPPPSGFHSRGIGGHKGILQWREQIRPVAPRRLRKNVPRVRLYPRFLARAYYLCSVLRTVHTSFSFPFFLFSFSLFFFFLFHFFFFFFSFFAHFVFHFRFHFHAFFREGSF